MSDECRKIILKIGEAEIEIGVPPGVDPEKVIITLVGGSGCHKNGKQGSPGRARMDFITLKSEEKK